MNKLFEYVEENYYTTEYYDYSEWEPKKNTPVDFYDEDLHFVEPIRFNSEWKTLKIENTKESFEKNLFNPIFNVSMSRYITVFEKNEEKIRCKFYYYTKYRAAGKKFYKIQTSLSYFTYNFIKNSFYIGTINNYHKKRKFTKSIKRVSPTSNPLSSLKHHIQRFLNHETTNSNQLIVIGQKVNDIYNLFFKSIPDIDKYKTNESFEDAFYKMYYDKQGVKLPNNWKSLIFIYPQPKLRLVRKCKGKYVDALMNINKLKGDKIRRVLHNVTNFNPLNFNCALAMFDEGTLLQQSDEFLKKLFESHIYLSSSTLILPPKEKKKAFEIFKLVVDEQIDGSSFFDHYRFYHSVIKFEKIKWESTDLDSFREEHLNWTERHNFYTSGNYKRIYDKNFISLAQEKIFDVNDNVYYPIVLTKSKEYNEESFTQSNCVKTYIQKPNSLIISLRKDSIDSKERATIEFSIIMIKDKIYLNRIQTLGRFNKKLDESWDVPIALLDSRIRNSMSEMKYEMPKIEVKFGHKTILANGLFRKVTPIITRPGLHSNKDKDTYYLNWDRDISVNSTNHLGYLNMIDLDYDII